MKNANLIVTLNNAHSCPGYAGFVGWLSSLPLCIAACLLVAGCDGSSATNAPAVAVVQLQLLAGDIGGSGNVDGAGKTARFSSALGVAVDAAGNVYVADSDNYSIRKIAATGEVTTFAGTAGSPGTADGIGATARFTYPYGIAIDVSGNLFVSDSATIRKITPAGVVNTYAGSAGNAGYAEGNVSTAKFSDPAGLALDNYGNLFVADQGNQVIRMITPAGDVLTLAGTPGVPDWHDGAAATALFNYPTGIVVDPSGTVYVADSGNQVIRVIAPGVSGLEVSTLAGMHGSPGYAEGLGSNAQFMAPSSLTLDSGGNLIVVDTGNHLLRKVTSSGDVTAYAGVAQQQGYDDGNGMAARFNYPAAISHDAAGNLYVPQYGDFTIRKISTSAEVTTIAGAPAISGYADGAGAAARFDLPRSIAVDAAGNAYVAEAGNNGHLRRITSSGEVTTLLDTLSVPGGVARDSAGNTYIADTYHHVIRKLDTNGTESVIAGSGSPGWDDGNGTSASFNYPGGVTVDLSGNVYVADTSNHTIRKIAPNREVTTIAGMPGTFGNVDETGTAARFRSPQDLVCDVNGTLYVADHSNFAIRKIAPGGIVTTFAGTMRAYGAVDGMGMAARFSSVNGIAMDSAGNLFVADMNNNLVRKISPSGDVTTVIGTIGKRGVKLGEMPVSLDSPRDVAIRPDGELLVATANGIVVTHGYK